MAVFTLQHENSAWCPKSLKYVLSGTLEERLTIPLKDQARKRKRGTDSKELCDGGERIFVLVEPRLYGPVIY